MDANRYTQAVEGLAICLSPTVVVVADGTDTWVCRRAAWDAARAALEALGEVQADEDDRDDYEGGARAYAELCDTIESPIASSQGPRGHESEQRQLVDEAVRRELLRADAARRLYGLDGEAE